MPGLDRSTELLAALRDFFLGPEAAALQSAAERLAQAGGSSCPVADWDEAEYAFNRLFVGPMAPQAPPFASVYLETEPRLMGTSTLQARHLYQMVGLVSPWQDTLPDDHLSLELDACLRIRQAALAGASSDLTEIYAYFLTQHMAGWLPLFSRRVREAPGVAPIMVWAVDELNNWLQAEMAWLSPGWSSQAASSN
ncbi:MAG: molecular chaperone TorD family protein [Desulfarculaceae bacterium]|nr:molecular chaperone TorD family protein [Desulfarculaceae bacterium]